MYVASVFKRLCDVATLGFQFVYVFVLRPTHVHRNRQRKFNIENLNGNIIEFTLWDEMAKHFKQVDLEKMKQPVIITVSACHVSEYKDYQLAASQATYYYLNPNIPEAEESRVQSQTPRTPSFRLIICKYPYEDIEQDKLRNRFLLKTLMEQNPQSYKVHSRSNNHQHKHKHGLVLHIMSPMQQGSDKSSRQLHLLRPQTTAGPIFQRAGRKVQANQPKEDTI
nr:hypothetical protein [Tanacetum cinerariifolium]